LFINTSDSEYPNYFLRKIKFDFKIKLK
jgi:hypothetical protein